MDKDRWRRYRYFLAFSMAIIALGLFLVWFWDQIHSYYCPSAGVDCTLFVGGNPIGRVGVILTGIGIVNFLIGLAGVFGFFRHA